MTPCCTAKTAVLLVMDLMASWRLVSRRGGTGTSTHWLGCDSAAPTSEDTP